MIPQRASAFVRFAIVAGSLGLLLGGPATALAHSLSVTYQSRLPLVVYLAGAGITVALSFAFVLIADVRADPPSTSDPGRVPPAPIRYGLKAVGLIGWLWIVAQGIAGGNSAGDVATLFLWVYGWVGVALLSAFVGPVWHWLNPFATLFDIGSGAMRRLGVSGWDAAEYPSWLGRWPAIAGLVFVIWVELVGQAGPSPLFVVLVGYTAFTLAMMAQFGRDAWRRERRDLQRLVRAARPPGAAGPRRRCPSSAPAAVRIGPARGRLVDHRHRPHRARHRVDPVRRPVADDALVFGLRFARDARENVPAGRLPRAHSRGGHRRIAACRRLGDRRRASCRSPSAT